MRTSLLLLFCIALIASCKKEEQNGPVIGPLSIQTLDGNIAGSSNAVVMDADSNIIMCGMSGTDILVTKITQNGQLVWRKQFNAGTGSTANALLKTGTNFFICGSTKRNTSNSDDILVVKLTLAGDTVWTKTFGNTGKDIGHCMVQSNDSNIVVIAETDHYFGTYDKDVYAMKMSPDGLDLWHTSYPYSGDEEPAAVIKSRINGSYFVFSNNLTNTFDGSVQMLSISTSGLPLWNLPIDVGGSIKSAIEIDNGNSFMLCGSTSGVGGSQALVSQVSYSGFVDWHMAFGADNINEYGAAVVYNSQGGMTIVGSGSTATGTDALVFNTTDTDQWIKGINLPEGGAAIALFKDPKDNTIVLGNTGTNKIFLVRTPQLGLWY